MTRTKALAAARSHPRRTDCRDRSVLRGARAGPWAGKRAPRLCADGISLWCVSEHCPEPGRERVAFWRRRHPCEIGDRARRGVRAMPCLIEHRETGPSARILGKIPKLLHELVLRFRISLQPREGVC